MDITLIDAAEGRVLGQVEPGASTVRKQPYIERREPTIAEDIAEILRLAREMKEETARVAAAQEAFWQRCTARIVERLASSS